MIREQTVKLLEEDEEYLTSKQYNWNFVSGTNEGFLIIKDYPLDPNKYQSTQSNIMIRIPQGYNFAALDCFYADPPIKLKETDEYPPAANQFPTFDNKTWQQFSRHFTNTPWRPGVDTIQTLLTLISKELQNR